MCLGGRPFVANRISSTDCARTESRRKLSTPDVVGDQVPHDIGLGSVNFDTVSVLNDGEEAIGRSREAFRMKRSPDDQNEVLDPGAHSDPDVLRLTALVQLPAAAALAVVGSIAQVVQNAHAAPATSTGSIERAQRFEEGDVFMVEQPFPGFFADRYLMDFFDARQRDACSRMHVHTGLRFVRIMTGPETLVVVSSLSEAVIEQSPGWSGDDLERRIMSSSNRGGEQRAVHGVVVPPNSWVDVQIPRGVSHQFNADGPNAVIDSVHPEESIETLREEMSGYRMMAQTIFLAAHRDSARACLGDP